MFLLPQRQLVVAVWLAALVLANLALDVGLVWLTADPWLNSFLHEAVIGLLLGQVILVGFWFGLGDGRWYVRGGIAIAGTLGVARTIGIGSMLSANERRNGDPNMWAGIAFVMISLMLTAALLSFLLRRFRGWRLTWDDVGAVAPGRQFQLSDVMLWTVIVSGTLAAMRFVATLDENLPGQLLDLSIIAARGVAGVLCGMLAGFATRQRVRTAVLLTSALMVAAVVLSLPDLYAAF